MIGKMVARNSLIVLNQGKEFAFRRAAWGSMTNLTFAATRPAPKKGDGSVLEETTLSDHRCIELSLKQRRQAMDKYRGGKGSRPSWNIRRLGREKLREHLEETRLNYELGRVCPAGSLEATVRSARQKVVAACDCSMPRRKRTQARGSMY